MNLMNKLNESFETASENNAPTDNTKEENNAVS